MFRQFYFCHAERPALVVGALSSEAALWQLLRRCLGYEVGLGQLVPYSKSNQLLPRGRAAPVSLAECLEGDDRKTWCVKRERS